MITGKSITEIIRDHFSQNFKFLSLNNHKITQRDQSNYPFQLEYTSNMNEIKSASTKS